MRQSIWKDQAPEAATVAADLWHKMHEFPQSSRTGRTGYYKTNGAYQYRSAVNQRWKLNVVMNGCITIAKFGLDFMGTTDILVHVSYICNPSDALTVPQHLKQLFPSISLPHDHWEPPYHNICLYVSSAFWYCVIWLAVSKHLGSKR
jgi:hypothetical protein